MSGTSPFKPEWGYAATDWADELQLKELHEATKSRKLNWDQLGDDFPPWALYIAIGGTALSVFQLVVMLLCALHWQRKRADVRRVRSARVTIQNRLDAPPVTQPREYAMPPPPLYLSAPVAQQMFTRFGQIEAPGKDKLERGGLDF